METLNMQLYDYQIISLGHIRKSYIKISPFETQIQSLRQNSDAEINFQLKK